ncbi:MAG: OmpH family outer membrane protein [Bacteroidales bacterium]|jgi:outer membrane protein|nr:OmpH family outer membrane protein [Bacteroidales bacterium]
MNKTFQIILLAVSLTFAGNIYAQKALKIGHFNSTELVKRMPEADSVKQVLTNYISAMEADFQSLQAEYQKSLQDYQAKESQLSDMLKQSKQKELAAAQKNLQDTYQSMQDSIQGKQTELMNGMYEKVRLVVAEIAKEEGLDYVLESSSGVTWFAKEEYDITPKLVKKLNLK